MFILSMRSMDQDKNNFFLFNHSKDNDLLEKKFVHLSLVIYISWVL